MSFEVTDKEERQAWDRYFTLALRLLVYKGIGVPDAMRDANRWAGEMLTLRRDVFGAPDNTDPGAIDDEEPERCPHCKMELIRSADGLCSRCWKKVP